MPSRSNQSPRPRNERPGKTYSPALHVLGIVGKVVGTILLVMVLTAIILACFAMAYIKTVILPQAHLEANFDMNLTSTIYYMDPDTGEYTEHLSLHGAENRELVTYDQLPENLVNATIAIEDERFLTHNGVDWKRTINGVLLMFTGKDIQGGSTITQQLIKNATQYDDVTVKRKILEIFTALDFDATYSKEQIMEWYLNLIYLGDNCYGVATAAENYFGKNVSELSLAECASLISITNNPTLYGPNSTVRVTNEETGEVTTGRERNKKRQELVLWKMLDLGMISQEEYDQAVAEELVFTRSEDEQLPSTVYSWYDEQVITDVINDLVEEYGYSKQLAENMVYSGGLKIYACVDTRIQSIVESVYYDASNLQLTSNKGQNIQSSIVIIDPEGNVVGLAGALGEKTANRVLNMASGTVRQPGSSIKPLSVYGPAIEMGMITPASVYADEPVRVLNGNNWPLNNPQTYRGNITVNTAVEVSSNPVAVRILEEMGAETSFDFVEQKFHIDLEDYERLRLQPAGPGRSDPRRQRHGYGGGLLRVPPGRRVYRAQDLHQGHPGGGRGGRGAAGQHPDRKRDHPLHQDHLLYEPDAEKRGDQRYRYCRPHLRHDGGRQDRFHQRQQRPLVRGLYPLLHRRRVGGLSHPRADLRQQQPCRRHVAEGHEQGP